VIPWLSLAIACGETPVPRETPDPPPHTSGSRTEAEPSEQAPEPDPPPPPEPLIAIDTHVDTTLRMIDDGADVTSALEGGHLDFPRMREGGLSGAFFSVWVNPRRYRGEAAWERALAMARAIRQVSETHPDVAALCTTGDEVRRAVADGKIALLIGVEGAHALGTGDRDLTLSRLRELYDLGARYMTITWSTDNPLGHSSSGRAPARGLTELGREVVREMNRMGMIVDVSHVSDQTFSDIMDVTEKPVLASHSSCRALSDHPRNMTDEMIRRVGENGGAVCVNYFATYVDAAYAARRRVIERQHRAEFAAATVGVAHYADRGRVERELALGFAPDLSPPTLATLGEHFAHIRDLVGEEHVCLGSDFDGVSELPVGFDDVSDLGLLLAELERRGMQLRPILGGNVLRVLDAQRSP
jgi:membrane dipeptidase